MIGKLFVSSMGAQLGQLITSGLLLAPKLMFTILKKNYVHKSVSKSLFRTYTVFSGNASNLVHLSLKPEPWGNFQHQRSFMDNLAKKLNINKLDDWYKVSSDTVKLHGGSELLSNYKGLLYDLLQNVYPEYPMIIFIIISSLPKYRWDMDKFTRIFMDDLAKKLNISTPEAWLKISWKTLQANDGERLLHKYNSLARVLRVCYPQYL